MYLSIHNIAEEALLDDDPRLEALTQFRWTASFNKGFRAPGKGYYTDCGMYVQGSPGSRTREYAYIRRQWRDGDKVKSQSLQAAVLLALSRPLPGQGERIWFGPGGHLDFRSVNLLVQPKPYGGWLLRPKNKLPKL